MENQRVIMIKGDKSKWYDQVIFIAKKDRSPKLNVDLVAEAERIVDNYLYGRRDFEVTGRPEAQVVKPKKKKDIPFDALLNVVMVLSCITLAGIVAMLAL